ncbi:hypothetical protein [Pedobacter sp.]|uniref:hypothetical protein n=1 Tax=Pedobacter sp. TaxID=1411316 RepID=UPI0031E2D1DF
MIKPGRLLINLTSPKESYHLIDRTESYYSKLRLAYLDILNDKVNDYLYFAFVTLCSATLEYSLNYILANHCVAKFGPESYKLYLEPYIKISFAKKLMMLPNIISDGRFLINNKNVSYLKLVELTILRNRLLHNKTYLGKLAFSDEIELLNNEVFIPETMVEFTLEVDDQAIDILSKQQCLEFGNALGDFKKMIMDKALINELEVNDMIIFS